MTFKDTPQYKRGRIGEILQFHWYRLLGAKLAPLADRTDQRAPMLHGPNAQLISPDTLGMKSADFFLEFKTKSHHFKWGGGSRDDKPHISARTEEGIDGYSQNAYKDVEREWKRPVVLSILSIKEATIIAATFHQLGEPRHSPNDGWPLVNWDIRSFTRIAQFDPVRLRTLFNSKHSTATACRERWLKQQPYGHELERVLDWLGAQQSEFKTFREYFFDHVEREWHR